MTIKRLQETKKTQSFYDRISDVHHLMMKLNGYRKSVATYLRSLDLNIDENSYVLDAGSGTGIISLGFHDAGFRPRNTVTLDLSFNLLEISREQFQKEKGIPSKSISPVQGNILSLPFADQTFDMVMTCGVLEYVPLDLGLAEFARVMDKGAKLVLIPVKPSFVGSVLELLYKFKSHKIADIKRAAEPYFSVVGHYEFPLAEPISWSKTLVLLEKT